MILQPVLVPIPVMDGFSPPQRVQQQRDYARRALRCCAELCAAPWGRCGSGADARAEVAVKQSPDGVPIPLKGYHWSVSHKRRWAAAVIADHPVGIDIEQIHPRRGDLFKATGDDKEWALLGDRSWHSFFRLFTAKEATLKANGVGIGYLSACRLAEVTDDRHVITRYNKRDWRIEHFEHDGHIAAVTCADSTLAWHVVSLGE